VKNGGFGEGMKRRGCYMDNESGEFMDGDEEPCDVGAYPLYPLSGAVLAPPLWGK